MKYLTLFLLLAPAVLAKIGGSCSSKGHGSGTCQKTSDCGTGGTGGFWVSGACPNDPDNVRCCIKKTCGPSGKKGICGNKSAGCSGGKFMSGFCPGDSSIQCCVKGGDDRPDPPSGGGGHGFTGADILKAARKYDGNKYVWGAGGCGGPGKGGAFDCSGLTQYALCKASGGKVKLPRVTKDQYGYRGKYGRAIPVGQKKPGDLLFYSKTNNCRCDSRGHCKGVTHTAIYAGNGRIFHAANPSKPIGEYRFYDTNICEFAIRHW